MPKKYRYRHNETYKDVVIDIKSNSIIELQEELAKKHRIIDRRCVDADMDLLSFGTMYINTYKAEIVSRPWLDDINRIFTYKIVPGIGNKKVSRIMPLEVQRVLNSCSEYSASYTSAVSLKKYEMTAR